MAGQALTVDKVTLQLGVSDRTIRRMIAANKIQAYRVGERGWRIDQTDLDTYIEQQKKSAQERQLTQAQEMMK